MAFLAGGTFALAANMHVLISFISFHATDGRIMGFIAGTAYNRRAITKTIASFTCAAFIETVENAEVEGIITSIIVIIQRIQFGLQRLPLGTQTLETR